MIDFLERCYVHGDGFVSTREAAPWRLGVVLLASTSAALAVVQKAPVVDSDYEFAGMYALPGGMVRASYLPPEPEQVNVRTLVTISLKERARQEAGLYAQDIIDLRTAAIGPVVTSYNAKGQRRFAVITAKTCCINSDKYLIANDSSIDKSFWMKSPPNLLNFAPANCVIISHIVWDYMDDEDRKRARPYIEYASARCSNWATALGLPGLPLPWGSASELEEWRAWWARL